MFISKFPFLLFHFFFSFSLTILIKEQLKVSSVVLWGLHYVTGGHYKLPELDRSLDIKYLW